ncbi:MAG: GNAT family N-acetyltransferase [Sphingobacteriaceae bacterium]|jgi:GNAT superfamily N-acetyltransferase
MNNLSIKLASIEDIPAIVKIAYDTWFVTYQDVISQAQIEYMFGEMYTPESIYKQMDFYKHAFLILYQADMPIGFSSYGKLEEPINTFKLHKLYLLPSQQNKGFGRILLNEVEKKAADLAANHLQLNVNRKNPALSFYEKLGYEIIETVDIPFAEFWLNDYVLAKKIV